MEFARRSKWGRDLKRIAGFAVSLLFLGGAVSAAPPAQKLAITAATWKIEKSELKVEGVSKRVDGVVLVRDAMTRKLLGSAAVRADGKWMLKIRDPGAVPSRMRAELEGTCVECVVSAAPDTVAAVAAQAPAPSSE